MLSEGWNLKAWNSKVPDEQWKRKKMNNHFDLTKRFNFGKKFHYIFLSPFLRKKQTNYVADFNVIKKNW